jgi:hypothetical protein
MIAIKNYDIAERSPGARGLDYGLKILYGRLPPSLERVRAVNPLTLFNTSFFGLHHYVLSFNTLYGWRLRM